MRKLDAVPYLAIAASLIWITGCASCFRAKAQNTKEAIVTVTNPSFEDGHVPGDIYTAPAGGLDPQNGVPGWQFNPSSGDSYSGIITETGTKEIMGSPKYIPQGWQAAFIQGTGRLSQTVNFNQRGAYVIRFRAAGRINSGKGGEPIAVSVDGNKLGIFKPVTNDCSIFPFNAYNSCPPGGGGDLTVSKWTLFTTVPFNMNSGAYMISFSGTISRRQSDRTTFIDTIQIVSSSEMDTAAVPTSPIYDIVFLGDSITAGAIVPDPKTEAPPVCCMQSLGERYDIAVRISNQGASGSTTFDWLPKNRFFHLAIAAAASLETNQPGQLIFSIMLGANDSAEHGPSGSPVSPTAFRRNLQAITDQLLVHYPDAYIFIHYPIFYSTNTQNRSLYGPNGWARLQSYFPQLTQLIASNAIIHPGRVFAGDKMAYDYFSTNYLTNMTPESGKQGTFYLHPNRAGAIELGKFWADAIAIGTHMTEQHLTIRETSQKYEHKNVKRNKTLSRMNINNSRHNSFICN